MNIDINNYVQKMVNNRVQNSCLTLSKNKLKMLYQT